MSSNNTSIFESRGWKIGMKYLYGWGAAVVILGALFKILHLPGASEMLIVGMGTETVVFFFSAFEPLPATHREYAWEKVYPQLATEDDEFDDELELTDGQTGPNVLASGLNDLNSALANNELQPEIFEQLRDSINGLSVNVTNLADISDATVATQEFNDKLRLASTKIDEMNSGYGHTVEAMNSFSNSIDQVKGYQDQIVAVTKNLESLNSVYELELQDAQKHLNSINKFYGSISGVMENLIATSQDTDNLRQEVGQLAANMRSLNNVYGNMLSAMASGASA